jgi:isopentenyldiphosphate isomerase
MLQKEESFEVVDPHGKVIGTARRAELHRNPSLVHRVVHVLVFNLQDLLLLQKRSRNKDTAPGTWDTSVGGHVDIGEDIRSAALRELREELAIEGCTVSFLYEYLFSNQQETELVSTFTCAHNGPFRFNREEIDDVRFWSIDEISVQLGSGKFSDHFVEEFRRYGIFRGRR